MHAAAGGGLGMPGGPVRLGVVGLGWWGGVLAEAVARSGAAEVVACFARTEASRERFAAEVGCRAAGSLPDLLEADDVEGVVFATPHTAHLEHVRRAAPAGRDVIVEKPRARTVADARAAVAAADRAGVLLMVGHQRRRQGPNRRMKRMIDDGSLGSPLLVESMFTVPSGYPATWRASRDETPLGAMTGLGVHMIDTALYLLGPVDQVAALSGPVMAGPPLDHATGLLLRFASGAVGTVLCSHFAPATCRLAVHGTGGSAISDGDGARLVVHRRGEPAGHDVELAAVDPLAEQMREFARAIRGEVTVETGGREAVAVVAVLEAAVASARSGTTVPVR
jgi:UDP-N-acetyl-2-amino-2-deoxyglucuronate dehydrogenase